MEQPKYASGDIVDTPYHGRRRILRIWRRQPQPQINDMQSCWMYEIEPPEANHQFGASYSEDYVNQGLFLDIFSGLDLETFQATYSPKFAAEELIDSWN